MIIRKANENDIDKVEKIYDAIHTAEENGEKTIGWIRGVYPVRATAENALKKMSFLFWRMTEKYTEVGIVPTDFNGIAGIDLVLLEKYIGIKDK